MKSYGETSLRSNCWLLFGWIMNFWGLLGFIREATWVLYRKFYFDLSHAISNVIFLLLFSTSWITILTRFKKKYGILDEHNVT